MELRDRSMPRLGVAGCAATAAVTTVRRSTESNGLLVMRLSPWRVAGGTGKSPYPIVLTTAAAGSYERFMRVVTGDVRAA